MNSFKNKDIAEVLDRKYEIERKRAKLPWGIVNLGLSMALAYDMKYGSLSRFLSSLSPLLWYLEIALLVIFVLNVIFNLGSYGSLLLGAAPPSVSIRVRTLLGIKTTDENFRPLVEEKAGKSNAIKNNSPFAGADLNNFFLSSTPIRSSGKMLSSFNSSLMSSSSYANSFMSDTSQMMSTSASSWTYFDGDVSAQFKKTQLSTSLSPLNPEDVVLNESSLNKYLNEMRDVEDRLLNASANDLSNASSTRSGHWSTNATFGSDVASSSGNKFQYKLSTRGPMSNAKERDSSAGHEEEVWSRLGVSSEVAFMWTENLRKWFSKTVLSRLVAEIDKINESLHWQGVTDVKIGEVSLAILQLRAKGPQFSTLYAVLQYLQVTTNQEYLVQRLRDLVKGGCMSEFRWNRGGAFKGKPWADHLPTDSTIVIHLLCVYLDSRLPLHSGFRDGKPFTNKYFFKTPDQPDATRKQCLCIYQSVINPPYFKLIAGDEVWELPKGRNNLFHAILLFLHLLKTREDGMLNRINMGPSGLNMMWIIE